MVSFSRSFHRKERKIDHKKQPERTAQKVPRHTMACKLSSILLAAKFLVELSGYAQWYISLWMKPVTAGDFYFLSLCCSLLLPLFPTHTHTHTLSLSLSHSLSHTYSFSVCLSFCVCVCLSLSFYLSLSLSLILIYTSFFLFQTASSALIFSWVLFLFFLAVRIFFVWFHFMIWRL